MKFVRRVSGHLLRGAVSRILLDIQYKGEDRGPEKRIGVNTLRD
jgi:hypothetical protein